VDGAVHVTGDVTVLIAPTPRQGHETTFAQIVSESCRSPTDKIEIVFGDTDSVQFGLGITFENPSLSGGTALVKATDKIIAKGPRSRRISGAGEAISCSRTAPSTVAGHRSLKVVRRQSSRGPVSAWWTLPVDVLEPGMEEKAFYGSVNFTYPRRRPYREVEIDRNAESVDLVSYVRGRRHRQVYQSDDRGRVKLHRRHRAGA